LIFIYLFLFEVPFFLYFSFLSFFPVTHPFFFFFHIGEESSEKKKIKSKRGVEGRGPATKMDPHRDDHRDDPSEPSHEYFEDPLLNPPSEHDDLDEPHQHAQVRHWPGPKPRAQEPEEEQNPGIVRSIWDWVFSSDEKSQVLRDLHDLFEKYVFEKDPISKDETTFLVFQDFFNKYDEQNKGGNRHFKSEVLEMIQFFETVLKGSPEWLRHDYPFLMWMHSKLFSFHSPFSLLFLLFSSTERT